MFVPLSISHVNRFRDGNSNRFLKSYDMLTEGCCWLVAQLWRSLAKSLAILLFFRPRSNMGSHSYNHFHAIHSETMRIFFLASLLTFAYSNVAAYAPPEPTDSSDGVPAAKINTTKPGSNVIVKLDCPGCPFIIRHGSPKYDEELFPSRPNSLVCL